ncbi:putative cyclomaltodextrin glucanotransferase [Thalassotalea insulae]|uniref:Cyclomaltodextrin glucanotransferase n=1 Tax=Thalassotalea insulae TaxID=2056778 RepID=A0ABQ6GWU7_9GAMM|nr:alpha-amylase family glycosyl hydrolase [Thalassotalea insulae]GLX79205.1 putative cyclomaltodextrin glucanotransferase [Thalassotalea insulae]
MKKNTLGYLAAMMSTVLSFQASAEADTSVNNKINYGTDVVYQIVTDRFVDGDTSNNPSGALYDSSCANLKKYCGGDWQGIIDKLNDGYFSEMGISALWISQPVENIYSVLNDTAGSTAYHGYWARDFKRTNPFFGSFADFDNLIQTAHSKGIKVIIDFAPNHTSPASESDTSYAENGKLYDNGVLVAAYTNDTDKVFHHNGGTDFSTIEDGIYRNLFDLADFNHQNTTLDAYLTDAIQLWLDKGIDGIRVDAVKHMPQHWQKKWMDSIYAHQSVFSFGEWFLSEGEVDPANHEFANESGMSLLDFRFAQKARQVFRNRTETMSDLHAMIADTDSAYNEVIDQVTFIDNHDMDRFHEPTANQRELEQALAFALTARGVPAIYYGSEQYMTGYGDPNNRGKMTSFDRTTTAYQLIKALAPLRKTNPALAYGDTEQRWLNDDVYVYERQFGDNVVLVAINRSETTSFSLNGLYTDMPAGTYTDVLSGLLNGESITVAADKSVSAITLSAGEVGVWQYTAPTNSVNLGHVGPMMARTGQQVTLDGRGFGGQMGQVMFGSQQATVVSWEDSQIVVNVPQVAAGQYDIKVVDSSNNASNSYDSFEVLDAPQVTVRFVIHDAGTDWGQNVYLVGNQDALGNWDTAKAIGPLYNQVMYSYPSWYFDVSVPANKAIEYKFIKSDGTNVTWENGSNHSFTSPVSGVTEVQVNWQ